jgi:hypothetical protein
MRYRSKDRYRITARDKASATIAAGATIAASATIAAGATIAPRGFRGLGPRSRHDEAPRPALSAGRRAQGLVEVPGIEPGSFVASSGLLRAQLTMPLLGPTDHVSKLV